MNFKRFSQSLPDRVNLLAVSKGHSIASIRSLAAIGQADFGESRLQEALPKIKELGDFKDIRWHFIGRLQSNKVRRVVRSFSVIHSVDSYPLADLGGVSAFTKWSLRPKVHFESWPTLGKRSADP